MALLLVLMPSLGFVAVGLLLVIGSLKGLNVLTRAPKGWFYFFPYGFLTLLFGERSIYYLHISVGVLFVWCGIWMFVYGMLYL